MQVLEFYVTMMLALKLCYKNILYNYNVSTKTLVTKIEYLSLLMHGSFKRIRQVSKMPQLVICFSQM